MKSLIRRPARFVFPEATARQNCAFQFGDCLIVSLVGQNLNSGETCTVMAFSRFFGGSGLPARNDAYVFCSLAAVDKQLNFGDFA